MAMNVLLNKKSFIVESTAKGILAYLSKSCHVDIKKFHKHISQYLITYFKLCNSVHSIPFHSFCFYVLILCVDLVY